jgi:hypothetical protein
MNKYLIITVLLFCTSVKAQWYVFKFKKTAAQKEGAIKFQKDQDGKIIFYEVVTVDSVPRDTLWKNARVWIRSILNDKSDKVTDEQYLYGTLDAKTSFMVYTSSIISKTPHGRIFYDVNLEVRDKKYRYTFSNFIFQPYKQDRKDLKYYPIPKNFKPLEDERYGGYQQAWDEHRYEVKRRVESQIAYLKREIVKKNMPKSTHIDSTYIKPVIKSKDW